ncbi:helix-turn-helix transcriptional regulator [Oceanisphaera sp. DM8]|uniref:Helix-turn-helix transcriptional regulator n=2 Tax=Oceanisphaera pacifica TaxID=2818389 RepID=A0ABS3NDX1_9GAMM|nr:helix-turn-helix transcriptional regulator [Oceanisphaera pacifica]
MDISQQQLLSQLTHLTALPRPLFGQQLSLPNHAISTPHCHPWAQLSYAIRGVIKVNTPKGQFIAPPTHGIFIPPQVMHGVHSTSHTLIRSLYIDADTIAWQSCQVLSIEPLLKELIIAFSAFPVEYDEQGSEGRLVAVLLDRLASAQASQLMLPWPNSPSLIELCRYLAQHPDDCRPLAHFSGALAISDKTLSRGFKKETGMNFRQWRQRSRLLAALPLLESGMRITDVALACGYDSLSAFIAAFKALLGSTPGEYLIK